MSRVLLGALLAVAAGLALRRLWGRWWAYGAPGLTQPWEWE